VCSSDLKSLLPQRWEHIGDVIIIRVPEQLEPYAGEAAASYAKVLKAKAVIREVGRIRGVYRTPEMEVLYGTDTETVHFENGIYYKLDAAKLMFSSGNIDEKLRMAALDCAGETVVDMFAGIGYFTLPLAVHTGASKVIACEINPLAFRYLQENVRLNRVEKVVQLFHGDNRELPGERIADRVIMGYVRTTGEHLEKAFDLVKPGGTIHYQDTFPLEVWPQMALDNVARASKGRRYEVMLMKEVKSYSPGVSHMVLDIKVLD
jgi:tRNA wybutosine-synthesizing protein 2